MKLKVPQNLRTEQHPFRQVAVTSFILGGLTIVLGVILLLSVKSDFKLGYSALAIEKIIAGITFISIGGNALWRGYQDEYNFDIKDVFDPAHNANINYLLGQRGNNDQAIAKEYARMMRSRSYSLSDVEKSKVSDWQYLFYKLLSKKDITKTFDYLPYPITRFIANQSKPIALLGSFLLLLICFLFLSYLEIFPFEMVWINLFILVGLLSLWRPSKIDSIVDKQTKDDLRNRTIFFIVFFIVTIFLYKPYAGEVNTGLFTAILIVAAIMVATALLSFKLIEYVFSKREIINVNTSFTNVESYRAFTQSNNIFQQFDNVISSLTGWYFKGFTTDNGGNPTGKLNNKGTFEFECAYETYPKLISTKYDNKSESLLKTIWKVGTILLCIGLFLIFFGIIATPPVDANYVRYNPESALTAYSPKILLSLFLVLFGIAIYFFGRKLVYEIYLFFNTEIFFESDLIVFNCRGNYDEFEHTNNGMKRKDTATDFTPDIKVSTVISSLFVHPYMQKESIVHKERFITRMSCNENLLREITDSYKKCMGYYVPQFLTNNTAFRISNSSRSNLIP